MEFRFLTMFTFLGLGLAVMGSHPTHPSEIYWKSVLPNIPIPKSVLDLLRRDLNVGRKAVGLSASKATIDAYLAWVASPSEYQAYRDSDVVIFFLEENLSPGTKMNLDLTKTITGATFLPRQVADAIPFSSNKLSDILNRFWVKPNSEEAEAMKETIKSCELPAEEGEDKHCATSLESMIDFSISQLGTNVQALWTEVDGEETQKQQYSITPDIHKFGYESVVCHGVSYTYAVFYCHAVHATRAYVVPLVSADGKKAKAVAVCHEDTSNWNPKHLAFQALKVEPGTVPVCHFLPQGPIIWARN